MTPENWRRLQPEFNAALDLSLPDRLRYVDRLMVRDEQLGRQLASLLRAHERTTSLWTGGNLLSEEVPIFSPGETILDRFQVVRLLGSGGMGDVYEANDWETERIALKTIRPELVHAGEVLAQFRKEVRLARRVDGPNVCRIHEFFLLPADKKRPQTALLTMEFLEGVTLADRVGDGALPWREAERIALQICQGLHAVHGAGLIHRDLKTRNVMLSVRGGKSAAVLMDFGLALENVRFNVEQVRSAAAATAASAQTLTGTMAADLPGPGTPQYMAPEQWEKGELTPATDIYALGLVLYEMVTGLHPFQGSSIVQMALRRGKPIRKASSIQHGLPHRWDEVIDRCLSYDPARRFQSAVEVAELLRTKTALRAVLDPLTKSASRHPIFAAAGLLLCGAGLSSAVWYQNHRYYAPPPNALRWYNVGMTALEEGAYYKASNAFEKARNEDNQFALARARLAETWSELDYKGKADEEIGAIEPASENKLRRIDQDYVEAVRASLHDKHHEKAILIFKTVLNGLPKDQKAFGYVDLGREYERAGQVEAARAAYQEAIRMAPESPLPYVRLGSLQTRQKNDTEAEVTLSEAASLYQTLASAEGAATVNYLRGLIASNLGELAKARAFLNASFASASSVPSVPLEARALTAISGADEGPRAIQEAKDAGRFAHDNRLPYWEAEALLREGNAYLNLDKPDLSAAEDCLTRSLRAGEDNDWPFLRGLAQLSLAALRDAEGKPDPTLAKAAAEYFRQVSFAEYTFQALTLLARAQNSRNDFSGGLKTAEELLTESAGFKNKASIAQAEEIAGESLFSLERYPDALGHYRKALESARDSGDTQITSYELFHCADTLVRLGEYDQAEEALQSIPASQDPGIGDEVARIRCEVLVSRGRYREALTLSRTTLNSKHKMNDAIVEATKIAEAKAAAGLHLFDFGVRLCRETLDSAQQRHDGAMAAAVLRVEAEIDLSAGRLKDAIRNAETALRFFLESGEKESEWLDLVTLAVAHERSNNSVSAFENASQANSRVAALRKQWNTDVFTTYTKRPDIAEAMRELEFVTSRAKREN